MVQTRDEAVKIWRQCEKIALLSDQVFKAGPLNLGLDSALALIPVAGGLYTIGVGGWLLYMGWKAGAAPATLIKMAGYVGVDAATAEVPVLGSIVDILFPGHVLATKVLKKDIESRFGPISDTPRERKSWARFAERVRTTSAA